MYVLKRIKFEETRKYFKTKSVVKKHKHFKLIKVKFQSLRVEYEVWRPIYIIIYQQIKTAYISYLRWR
jgi:hypothetical protein